MNVDFDGSRKEFWAFVGRRTKGKKKNIMSLKSDAGVSVKSTRGKLEVLQKHYQHLGKISVDSDFDANWKEEVGSKVSSYGSMSEPCEDDCLDIAIEKGEIVKCIRKPKNNKTGGSDGLVGELLKYGGSGMVCFSCFQLSGMRKPFPGNGEKALSLICLRRVIGRIRVIIEASLY